MNKLSVTILTYSMCFICFYSHAEGGKEETSIQTKKIILERNIEFSHDEKILQQQEELASQSNSFDDVFMENLSTVIKQAEWKLSKFYLWRANAYFMQGHYSSSEANYRRSLQIDPDRRGFLHYKIGECLYKQVKYHEALDMFRKARSAPEAILDSRTHYIYPYYEGLCLIQIKKLDEAKVLFDQLKEDFPDRDLSEVYLWFPEENTNTKKVPTNSSTLR